MGQICISNFSWLVIIYISKKRSLYTTELQPAIETIPAYDQNGQATKLASVVILEIHEQDLSLNERNLPWTATSYSDDIKNNPMYAPETLKTPSNSQHASSYMLRMKA